MQRWWNTHPFIVSWLLLSIGMGAILLVASRDVPLLPLQRFWLLAATVLLAALCVWILSWEDEPTDGEPDRRA